MRIDPPIVLAEDLDNETLNSLVESKIERLSALEEQLNATRASYKRLTEEQRKRLTKTALGDNNE